MTRKKYFILIRGWPIFLESLFHWPFSALPGYIRIFSRFKLIYLVSFTLVFVQYFPNDYFVVLHLIACTSCRLMRIQNGFMWWLTNSLKTISYKHKVTWAMSLDLSCESHGSDDVIHNKRYTKYLSTSRRNIFHSSHVIIVNWCNRNKIKEAIALILD